MRKPNDGARPEICVTIQPGTDHTGQSIDGLFDAFLSNRQLCASDRPLRDAAVELISLGAPPEALLVAWHLSGRRVTTTIGGAAQGLDVGFYVDNVVPFRRKPRPSMGSSGGDAA